MSGWAQGQLDLASQELIGDLTGVGNRSGQPVELGHDERVAGAHGCKGLIEAGARTRAAGEAVIGVDALGVGAPADEPSLDAFMEALRDGLGGASPGGSAPRQESLFDNAAAETLDAFEDLIDQHALRGIPAPLLQDVAGIARADPEIRRTLERTARECDAAGLRPAVTREARVFLFPRRRGTRRR